MGDAIWVPLTYFGLFLGAVVGRVLYDRRKAKHRAQLCDEALRVPAHRAAAIKQLKAEIEVMALGGRYKAGASWRRRRFPPLRKMRLVLAEVLLADDQPHEALQQLGFIALPRADELGGFPEPQWTEELRLLACEAELALRNPDAAAKWLEPCSNLARLIDMRAQIALLRGQYDEAMKHIDEASPLTRARVLAAAGHELRASEILRQLSHAELETIHRRYSTEPAGALALQLISGPYR